MITSIIFSKNRAAQLDLCINSIKKNFFKENIIKVIYVASQKHMKSYETLKHEHPDVIFIEQPLDIFECISATVSSSDTVYIAFFTDDDLFFQPPLFNVIDLEWLTNQYPDICCVSLRMGVNITHRDVYGDGNIDEYPKPSQIMGIAVETGPIDKSKEIHEKDHGEPKFILWNKTSIPCGGYWSIDFSVDGHIFEKEKISKFCEELVHQSRFHTASGKSEQWLNTPNIFEAKLQRFYFESGCFIVAPMVSCVVNSPNNRTQDDIENRNGDIYPVGLNESRIKFEQGFRFDLDNLDFTDINCPHKEIRLRWKLGTE